MGLKVFFGEKKITEVNSNSNVDHPQSYAPAPETGFSVYLLLHMTSFVYHFLINGTQQQVFWPMEML